MIYLTIVDSDEASGHLLEAGHETGLNTKVLKGLHCQVLGHHPVCVADEQATGVCMLDHLVQDAIA